MMNMRNMRGVAMAAMLAVCGGAGGVAWVQAQPGQPSEPAKQNDPGKTNPNQPGKTNPNDPGRTNPYKQPGDRNAQPGDRTGMKNQRPFAFQSPDAETRFNESGRRLVAMERRMGDSNRELMRKLSEARSMTGPQQNQAMLDLMQQILQEHQQLHEYLVQARTGWTGDLEGMDTLQRDGTDAQRRPIDPARPSTDATPRDPR
ncbi:MAG: hypothetical protein IT436_04490 [Phycisphaerales bacterium]|nr:hypothetical protein [Phycisphaerales bacterium]